MHKYILIIMLYLILASCAINGGQISAAQKICEDNGGYAI